MKAAQSDKLVHARQALSEFEAEMATWPSEPWTAEECLLSTPYSERATWRRILARQIRLGTSRFQGPPGLLDKMVRRLSSFTAAARAPTPSTPATPDGRT